MTAIVILPQGDGAQRTTYTAVAGSHESSGNTPGEALDALTPQLDQDETGTLVIVQHWRPDEFFNARQQQRLAELMRRWREARDEGQQLQPDEQAELQKLIEAETEGAGQRAEAALKELSS